MPAARTASRTKQLDQRKIAGISSEAVKKATGRDWPAWIKALNTAGAKRMEHRSIAEMLEKRFGIGPWWCQMVTVGYEQAAKGRVKHSKGSLFEISGSKTIAVPVGELFRAWQDPKMRVRWLPKANVLIRKATPKKSMRLVWDAAAGENATLVGVNFWPKGPGKSQVQLGHGKIRTAAAAEKLKRAWAARLNTLKSILEE